MIHYHLWEFIHKSPRILDQNPPSRWCFRRWAGQRKVPAPWIAANQIRGVLHEMFLTRTVLLHSWLLAFISLDGLHIMVSIYIYISGWWLVSTLLWKIWWKSVGMMTFPTEWKNKNHVPKNQPVTIILGWSDQNEMMNESSLVHRSICSMLSRHLHSLN